MSSQLVQGSAREVWAALVKWQDAGQDPAELVIDTSGSTGRTKQVRLSRAAMRASGTAAHSRLGGPGQWLLALPPSYVAGVQVLFRSALSGVEPVLLGEQGDLAGAVGAMTGRRRYLSLVPTQLVRALSSPTDVAALRRLDAILVGGAALDPRVRVTAAREGLRLVETYGMSETCGGCVYDGVAIDGVAIALSSQGGVRIAGPVLFDGYDGRPDLTAEVLRDGWFLTSDLGRFDEDGRLEVLGRADDVVVSGGVNVPANTVAGRLREHAAVLEAEVVGVPDPEWGHRVVAVLVTTSRVDGADMRDFVSQALPRAWAPARVVVVDEIPLLDNGKVDRLAVARAAAAESNGADPSTGRGGLERDGGW